MAPPVDASALLIGVGVAVVVLVCWGVLEFWGWCGPIRRNCLRRRVDHKRNDIPPIKVNITGFPQLLLKMKKEEDTRESPCKALAPAGANNDKPCTHGDGRA